MGRGARSRHLGLDLGATNLKWVVLEGGPGGWRSLDRGQLATEASRGPDAVIGRLGDTAEAARRSWPGIETLGVGVPGLFDAASGVTSFLPNLSPDWADLPLGPRLAERLGLPIRLINDARAFGLAELRLGAGQGCDTMVGLTLGSGVGGVVVTDGRVHFGHAGTGGEVGHQTLLPDGPLCTCGNRGCLEALANAGAVARACRTATAEEAVLAAQSGDRSALDGLQRIGTWLGIGIANLIVVLTPDRVVLGGGVAGAGDLLIEPIRREVRRRVHVTDLDAIEIVTAQLGTWAGAIGAGVHGAEAGGQAAQP